MFIINSRAVEGTWGGGSGRLALTSTQN